MKSYNITPKEKSRSRKNNRNDIDLLKIDMVEDDLVFDTHERKDIYIRVNVNFPNHTMTRVLGLN
jgi:hypothetical protein